MIPALLLASPLLAGEELVNHPLTTNAAKTRHLQSSSVWQKQDGVEPIRDLGSNIHLVDDSGTVLSTCFLPDEMVVEGERYPTRGYWNKSESILAMTTGGRTWSNLFFFSVSSDQIQRLPVPEWNAFLPPSRSGGVSDPMRMYCEFVRWLDEDTCVVRMRGTSYIGDGSRMMGADDEYVDYDAFITLTVSAGGVVVHYVKQTPPPILDPGGH